MSADLFAEFNRLSSAPEPASGAPSASRTTSGWSRHLLSPSQGASSPQPVMHLASVRDAPQPRFGAAAAKEPAFSPPAEPLRGVADCDDGEWGDFEVADSGPTPTVSHPFPPPEPEAAHSDPWQGLSGLGPDTALRGHQNHASSSWAPALESSAHARARPQARSASRLHTGSSDSDVLFDADDFDISAAGAEHDEGDDFGDFATVAQSPPLTETHALVKPHLAPSMDLLGLDDTWHPPTQESESNSAKDKSSEALSFGTAASSRARPAQTALAQHRVSSSGIGDKASENAKSSSRDQKGHSAGPESAMGQAIRRQPVQDGGDDWDAWNDLPSADASGKAAGGRSPSPDTWDWDAADTDEHTVAVASNDGPPPTNVPPPSVILSVFPDLFGSGNSLFKSIANQDAAVKRHLLSDPKVGRFLQGYVLLGMTAARIMAGRKLRWHRDKLLAKGMSISAAGSKGMKLAGVDKTQSTREDREAADVVAAWREHVGRLRAAVAAANAAGHDGLRLRVPELSENVSVQTAKMVPTARGPCIICGLKREERVAKVDVDVEDSFGEWWAEHWGHKTCKSFWLEHEQRLRQR